MKLPICAFCAQTGMLCNDCQMKLDQGKITETDIEISKVAVEYEKVHPEASDLAIDKTIETDAQIVIILEPNNLSLLAEKGKSFLKQLEKKLHKPVKLLDKGLDDRATIDAIFSPAKITGVNTVFVPIRSPKPGQSSIEEEMVIILAKEEKENLSAPLKEIRKLLRIMLGEEIRIEFR
jgi:hypothetical protein